MFLPGYPFTLQNFLHKIIAIYWLYFPMQSPGRIYQPADFNYKPNNYLALTVTLAIICGIFSVGSLFCTVPAIILSVKVQYFIYT